MPSRVGALSPDPQRCDDLCRASLAEREHHSPNAGIEEFDLERPVFHSPLLPNELIETSVAYRAGAAAAAIAVSALTPSRVPVVIIGDRRGRTEISDFGADIGHEKVSCSKPYWRPHEPRAKLGPFRGRVAA